MYSLLASKSSDFILEIYEVSYLKQQRSLRNLKKLIPGLLLGICCTAYAGNELIPQLMGEGMKNYSEKKYAAASDYLGQVVDMDPDHSQARYYLIYSLALSGNNELALKHAEILAKKFPNDPQYKNIVKQIKEEVEKQSIKIKKNEAASGKINKEVMIGGYKSFEKAYEMQKPKVDYTPRDITPERPLTDLEKAVVKIDEEDYATAESMLKAIIKKDSNNGEAYHNLGVVKMSQSNYKDAIKNFEKAAKLNKSNSFQSYFLMGNCYRYLGDNSNAEKALKSACDIKYDDFAQFNLGEVKVILGKYKEAEKIYKDILAKSPNFSDASVGLAQIKMEQGNLEEAMNMVNSAISKGNKGEANYVKALLLMENKMSNEALEEVEEAISVSPANVKYRVAKAKILIKMFEYSRGIDEASSILRSSPDCVPAMLVIAEAFASTSATNEATAQIEEVEKRGDFADTHRIKGIIAKAEGKEDVAKSEYEKYFSLTGTPSAEYEIAEFYEGVENGNSKAMQYYQDIVQSYPGTLYAIKANEALENLKASSDDSSSPDAAYNPGPSNNYRPGNEKF